MDAVPLAAIRRFGPSEALAILTLLGSVAAPTLALPIDPTGTGTTGGIALPPPPVPAVTLLVSGVTPTPTLARQALTVGYTVRNTTSAVVQGTVSGDVDGVALAPIPVGGNVVVVPNGAFSGAFSLPRGLLSSDHTATVLLTGSGGKTLAGPSTLGFYVRSLEPVLQTDYPNPVGSLGVCGGQQFPWQSNFEWAPVLDPDQTSAIAGTALWPKLSGDDLPFSHPFGFDFEFFVAPSDQRFQALLADSNQGRPQDDGEYIEAVNHAKSLGVTAPGGTLGVETDQGLVPGTNFLLPDVYPSYSPTDYRPREGDQVVVFGRWIQDCGHPDFHTEIHPPLMIAAGHGQSNGEETDSTLISRPYLIEQYYQNDSLPFLPHMYNELGKVAGLQSLRVEAHAIIDRVPFSGIQLLSYKVSPPSPRLQPGDQLHVSFHFTVRSGVAAQVSLLDADHIGVFVSMNPVTYKPAPLGDPSDWDIGPAFLSQSDPDLGNKISNWIDLLRFSTTALTGFCGAVTAATGGVAAAICSGVFGYAAWESWVGGRDVLTDKYPAAVASSSLDDETNSVSTDDNQPYPIYGWLDVKWVRNPPIDVTGGTGGVTNPRPPIGTFVPPIKEIPTPPDVNVLKGDINGNGQVDAGDAVLAMRIAVGLLIPSATQMSAGDVDGDGHVTLADAVAIVRIVAAPPSGPNPKPPVKPIIPGSAGGTIGRIGG